MFIVSEMVAAARRLIASLDALSLLLEETVAGARQSLAERSPVNIEGRPLTLPHVESPEEATNGKARKAGAR